MMPQQQQIAEDHGQLGNSLRTFAQGGRAGGGGNRGSSTERGRPNANTNQNTNGRFQSSNTGSSILFENKTAPADGRGRANGSGLLTGNQRGVRSGTNSANREERSPGLRGKDHVMTSQNYEWDFKQEGLTDLGKKKYSTTWLLERRDKEMAKGGLCDLRLPDSLHKHNLSLASQNRRYPFTSSPSDSAGAVANEDINTQEHTAKNKENKDYTISQSRHRGFHSKEATPTKSHKNGFPRQRRTVNNEKPAHHDNLFSPTTTKPSTTGVMAAVAEAMNVQSRPSANGESHQKNRLRGKEELHSYKKNPNHRSATTARPNFQKTATNSQVKNAPHDYHGNTTDRTSRSNVIYPAGQREFNTRSLAETYPEAPQKQFHGEQSRFSISSLKDSEREKARVKQMLRDKLRKYSVPPSRLAYASASASKLIKMELKTLGYVEVPTINLLNDTALTKGEITMLSFQHEIRKHYRSAILETKEELTKYREYLLKSSQKKRRYGGGQYF